MKRVKEIDYFKNIRQIQEFQFGVFYYFEDLVISEINEGVIFNFKMAQKALKAAHDIYGNDAPITYISNRVNNYYVMPFDWLRFYRNQEDLENFSVVGNTKGSFLSLLFERLFFRKSIPQFTDLEEAVEWSIEKINEKQALT